MLLLLFFQIFYDQESEVLLSHNCSSHVQKVEVRAAKTHPIEWNSVPLAVVCAFPYILAFSTDAIEFRYAVNGSLLQTLGMPELQLITAKVLKYISFVQFRYFCILYYRTICTFVRQNNLWLHANR